MADGSVVFDIKGNNKPIKETLEDTTTAIKKAGADWDAEAEGAGQNVSNSLIGAFNLVVKSAAFIKIGQMLVDLGIESVNLASDLQEVQNVVDVTFGADGAQKIEAWARTAQKQYGITELQAKQYTSTLGAMMKSAGMSGDEIVDMSMALAGLTADMASFYNLGFDEAFQKISAGLAGETEPLRRLGINLNVANLEAYALAQGIETAYEDMTQGEQLMLRYSYLMNATRDAQGDFLRTGDSYANTLKRIETSLDTLKANLGEALLSIVNPITQAVAEFLEILTLPEEKNVFDTASESMAEASSNAAQATSILDYMNSLQAKYGEAATQTAEWAAALERLRAVFPDINDYINAETGALTESNEQLKEYIEYKKQLSLEEAEKEAIEGLEGQQSAAQSQFETAAGYADFARAQMDAIREALINYMISSFQSAYEKGNLPEEVYQQYTDRNYEDSGMNYWNYMLNSGQFNMSDIFSMAEYAAKYNGQDASVANKFEEAYNQYAEMASSAASEMADLQAKMQSLESQLQTANEVLAQLAAAASSAALNLNNIPGGGTDGSHANGLDNVPFDGYIARLHRGERVITAAENASYRYRVPQATGVDYGAMGAAIGANLPNGGNMQIVWRGRVVADVLSEMQGDSYRALERSGWRS